MENSLKKFVNSYHALRREVRMNIVSGQSSLSGNELVRVQIPSTGLVDLSTFRLQGNIAVVGTGVGYAVPPTHMFIDRFSANLGGVNTGVQCQEYGRVAEAIKRCTMGDDAKNSHSLGNMNAKIPAAQGDDLAGDGFKEWGYYPVSVCQVNSTGILDVSTIGNCELEIQFNALTPYLLKHATATGTATGVSISNLRAYVNVIDLENGLEYAREQQALLGGEKAIKQVLPHIITAPQVANTSNNYNVSSGNVDMLMAIGFKNNPANGSDRYKFAATNGSLNAPNDKYFFQMGSVSMPAYGFTDSAYVGAIHSTNAWGKHNRGNTNSLYQSLTAGVESSDSKYMTDNHIIMQDITLAGPAWSNRLLSGASSQSANSVVRFENTGYATAGAQSFILGALCTGVLSVKGGGSVSFEA